ncbi:MAG TPA: methyltransferase cognate corrinoid protein [Thermoleophilia bacterium]|nr:methyltransferase cognate corrinoid protein [Thermoleophilia bacterium]
MANEDLLKEAREALLTTDKAKAEDVAKRAIAAGMDPGDIMQNGFVVGIRELGEKFDLGEVFLPELMLAAEAMEAAMEVCNAALPEGKSETRGVVVIGTVEGDVHDIGKAIVVAYLRANGYEVHDVGKDVPPQDFIDKAVEVNADVIGASALLTATLAVQGEIEEYLKEAGLRGKFKTIIGGATCTQGWADKIGADAYAKDASEALTKIGELVGR